MTTEALLDREVSGIDVKEAAQKAAAYTADMETLANPGETSLFLTKSGFAIESTRYIEDKKRWEIGVGFVRSFARAGNANVAGLGAREPLRALRTYKTVVISEDTGEVVSYS